VKKVEKEVEQIIRETGEKASFDCGVHDIHPEIINMLGGAQIPHQLIRKTFCSIPSTWPT
jgi:hypothetical protein